MKTGTGGGWKAALLTMNGTGTGSVMDHEGNGTRVMEGGAGHENWNGMVMEESPAAGGKLALRMLRSMAPSTSDRASSDVCERTPSWSCSTLQQPSTSRAHLLKELACERKHGAADKMSG